MISRPCSIDGCSKPARALGFCGTHYERWRTTGRLDLAAHFEDLTGRRFHRLVVKALAPKSPYGEVRWVCICDCGTESVVQSSNLKSEHTRSCGCLQPETASKTHLRHGESPTWVSWVAMKRRCSDPKYIDYHRYGGRGISVCDRWRLSFEAFVQDMGERPKGKTLDRYPNGDGNYEPGNCRWATSKEQAWNRGGQKNK